MIETTVTCDWCGKVYTDDAWHNAQFLRVDVGYGPHAYTACKADACWYYKERFATALGCLVHDMKKVSAERTTPYIP